MQDFCGCRCSHTGKSVVILAHGFSDSDPFWIRLARALENDYDLILPDARGHGRSARVQPGDQIDMVADLAGLIRGLGLGPVVIGGHSMGAIVITQVAAHHLELVKALVLEDPGWHVPPPPRPELEPQGPNPWIQFLMDAPKQPVEEIMAKCHADSPLWDEVELRPWVESKQQFNPNLIQASSCTPVDYLAVARAIRCPTLLLTANPRKGALVTPAVAK